jgi:hypothetical protein
MLWVIPNELFDIVQSLRQRLTFVRTLTEEAVAMSEKSLDLLPLLDILLWWRLERSSHLISAAATLRAYSLFTCGGRCLETLTAAEAGMGNKIRRRKALRFT